MISNTFSSNENKKIIISIIQENITSKFKKYINISSDENNKYIIDETIKYVLSQVNPTPPKGIAEKDYLNMMNKKVCNTVIPVIEQKIELENSNNVNTNISKNNNSKTNLINKNDNVGNNKQKVKDHENIFDELLIKNYEVPEIIEYPKPSFESNQIKSNNFIDSKIKTLESERSELTPKVKPIDFSIKNEEKNNTMQMYNNLLTNYNKPLENNNISSNNINNDNYAYTQNKLTPINMLNNNTLNGHTSSIPVSKTGSMEDLSARGASVQNIQGIDDIIEQFDGNSYNNSNKLDNLSNKLNNLSNKLNNNGPHFSNIYDKESDHFLVTEPDFEIINKNYYIIFDSSIRDLEEYPNQTSFQIKFSPAPTNYLYNNYYDKNNILIIKEKNISHGDGSSVLETFDNIVSISCKTVNAPLNIIYTGLTDPLEKNSINGTNIFKDPYIYLTIPELRGPYQGGSTITRNAFSKLEMDYSSNTNSNGINVLSTFTNLRTADPYEYFINDPVTLGKLDKMTLNLYNRNGQLFNFGIDKLFIKSFQPGNQIYNGYCGNSFTSTIITIENKNPEYTKYCSLYSITGDCTILNSHPIQTGDLLYFYDTLGTPDEIAFLESNVNIVKVKQEKNTNRIIISLYYNYVNPTTKKSEKVLVNMSQIIPQTNFNNYYIVFVDQTNTNHYLKVYRFTNDGIITEDISNRNILTKSIKIGIIKANLRGTNSEDGYSLISKNGFRAINVGTTINTQWQVEIDFPYENLSKYFKDPNLYKDSQIFLIQDKLQVSYTFVISTAIKSYREVKSKLNESGNN